MTKTTNNQSPTKQKEPFLDFEKDLDISDNLIIESYLTEPQIKQWKELKDVEDDEDFGKAFDSRCTYDLSRRWQY